MGRTKEYEPQRVKEAAYYIFAESKQKATVGNIAKYAGMTRTQLQNHHNIDDLRELAIDYALNQVTPGIFKIFTKEQAEIEVKVKLLVLHFMTKAKKYPNLISFINNEFDDVDNDKLKGIRLKAKEDIEPFIVEFEKQVDNQVFIDISPLKALIHIMSLASYPVIAKHAIQITTGMGGRQYGRILNQHSDEIVRFIFKGLQP